MEIGLEADVVKSGNDTGLYIHRDGENFCTQSRKLPQPRHENVCEAIGGRRTSS